MKSKSAGFEVVSRTVRPDGVVVVELANGAKHLAAPFPSEAAAQAIAERTSRQSYAILRRVAREQAQMRQEAP